MARVVVAMSGGVDSSVAAALLVEAGHEVIGVAMRLWNGPSDSGCCSLDDFLDARRVAARLGIRFYVMDFSATFEERVVRPFVETYLHGRTPNPCARCNQFVKFAALWERAQALGAEFLATGHYARVTWDAATGQPELRVARSREKDQSYFLFGVPRTLLPRLLFPVGDKSKAEVRELARQWNLPVAEKPESQEVCFVSKRDYASFVEQYGGHSGVSGPIVDENGKVIGYHEGIHRFTIGQRRGLAVGLGEPRYVVAVDAQTGTVRVGPKAATCAAGLRASEANWLVCRTPVPGEPVQVKIRSRFAPTPAVVTSLAPDGFELRVETGLPAVTPGQAAVLYDGDRVLGGGWIDAAI